MRLEQGRERHPSAQVLDALAHVLRLDDDARLHLHHLAGSTQRPTRGAVPERVDPELLRLMDAWEHHPAIVLGRAYDVLAANRLASVLFGGFRSGQNLLTTMFVDPAARSFYIDWERAASNTAAGFRILHGANPHDPRIRQVLSATLDASAEFAEMWARHETRAKRLESKRFRHPAVGEMRLHMNAFDVKSAPGQELIVYHAEPGSASAEALRLLEVLSGDALAHRG